MNKRTSILQNGVLTLALFLSLAGGRLDAGSAQWLLTPATGDWNTAGNWTPATVPNAATDVATFDLSNTTAILLSAGAEVNGIVFNAGASALTIVTPNPPPGSPINLILSGVGITNNSGITQSFSNFGRVIFSNSATAGINTAFTANSGVVGSPFGGLTQFNNASTAGSGTFITNGGAVSGTGGGFTQFNMGSNAGSGTFITNGATVASGSGGFTQFNQASTAANGTFTTNGATASGGQGGFTQFTQTSTAGNGTFTANGGTNGGNGGVIHFNGNSTGGTATVKVFGNGNLDISNHSLPGVTIGSIEGSGNVFLGANNLAIGSNNLSTGFSGIIQNGGIGGGTGGSLTKIGTGTLTLLGANTYWGATQVNAGVLRVNGSLAAASEVEVANGAKLEGTGTIAGTVTVADFGVLAPGGVPGPGTLTLGNLNLNPSSYLDFDLGAPAFVGGGTNDLLQVNGNLVLDGLLRVRDAGEFDVGTYRLINYTGTLTDNVLQGGQIPPGFPDVYFTIETSVAGQVNFVAQNTAAPLLFWDGARTVANGAVEGGSGTWNNVATNWTDSAGAKQSAWSGSRAVFTGAAGTVTLAENVATTRMQFVTDGYVINATAAETIELDGASILRVDAGATATINAALSGSGGLLFKNSPGTLVLNGINTYRFGTTVSGGTLLLNGATAVTSSVNVAVGATLGGTGTAAGSVTIANGGRLAPGVSGPGMFTAGALFLNASSNLDFDLGAPGVVGGTMNDLLAVGDNLVLDGVLNVANAGGFGIGTYRLFNYGGALTDNGLGIGTMPAGFNAGNFMIQTSVPGQVNLVVGAAPVTTLFWDGAQTVGNSAIDGGSGDWNTGTTNWTSADGVTNSPWGNTFAIFSGAAGGAVTLKENVSATGMQFATSGYTINADPGAAITLTGATTFRVDPGLSATINAPLTGGGSLTKTDAGTLTLGGDSFYSGGTTITLGVLAVRNPNGLGLGTGPVLVRADALGPNVLRFIDSARAGAVTITVQGQFGGNFSRAAVSFRNLSNAGTATITNQATGNTNGAGAALTQFSDTATAGSATISNRGSEFTHFAGSGGGGTFFYNDSTAATAAITNHGGIVAGSFGGSTAFIGNASADRANIINLPGITANARAGRTTFQVTSTAADAVIENRAVSVVNGQSGFTQFQADALAGPVASAGRARITNGGGLASGNTGGLTQFSGTATAGASTLFNRRGAVAGAEGGNTQFLDASVAGTSVFTNEGGQNGSWGFTEFRGSSNAQAATFFNGANIGGSFGGRANFYDTSKAGTATFDNEGGKVASGFGGEVFFFGNSSADASTITNRAKTVANAASGGVGYFLGDSKGGTATIVNEGSAFGPNLVRSGGWTLFNGGASAEAATIVNKGPLAAGGGSGETHFTGNVAGKVVTADRATITNEGGLFAVQRGGVTVFSGTATAGAATLTNHGALAEFGFSGATDFLDTASAGTASFLNKGGVVNRGSGGFLYFKGNTRAGQSTILNEGAAVAGAFGGYTFFFANSSADQATLRGLAGVAAGAGARFAFHGFSDGGTARIILEGRGAEAAEMEVSVRNAGMAIGSIEGTGTVNLGGNNLAVGTNNLSTEFAGLIRNTVGVLVPGSLTKVGTGTLTLLGDSTYTGGTTISFGQLRVGNPNGFGLGTGPVVAQASASPRDARLRFFGAANAGAVSITNEGDAAGKFEALTFFQHTASAGTAQITNLATQRANGSGGKTDFGNNASAGSATISNRGSGFSHFALTGGGTTRFSGASTAGAATITNHGGLIANSFGGETNFFGSASAGTTTFINLPAVVAGASAGRTTFQVTSTAADAVIENRGGILSNAPGGATQFDSDATPGVTAARARITNQGGRASGGTQGFTQFTGTASAGESMLFNEAATVSGALGGRVIFRSIVAGTVATAGNATIINAGANLANAGAGDTNFHGGSTAADGSVTNRGGTVAGASGGRLAFFSDATAARATIRNEGGTVIGAGNGFTSFSDSSTAGTATITNNAGTLAGAFGGSLVFAGAASAESATILNRGASVPGTVGGLVRFEGGTAGNAVFINEGQTTSGGGSFIEFRGTSTAGSATFTNMGVRIADQQVSALNFYDTTSAGSAAITNQGGAVPGARGGLTLFQGSSRGSSATITAQGASVSGADGGRTSFDGNSNAGNATLIVHGGTNGGGGGLLAFLRNATGGTARAVIDAGVGLGGLELSQLTGAGMSIGSIEGGGLVSLGSINLAVGTNNLSTTFSGVIRDGGIVNSTGGSLTKVGTGILTFSGANTYTGTTAINAGALRASNLNGSATGTGAVVINNTAVLTGSGAVTGSVTINSGGTISPGASAGTLSTGAGTWAGGGKYSWEIGAFPSRGAGGPVGENPGWDLLSINGPLNLTATSFNKFTIQITSLALSAAGMAGNFNSALPYRLTVATATGGIFGFDPAAFALSAPAFMNPLHGTAFGIEKTGNNLELTFKPPTGLTSAIWVSRFPFAPGESALLADPDGDGMSNLLEYSLGMDPLKPDVAFLPRLADVVVGGLTYQTLTYERVAAPYGPTDLTYTVQRNLSLAGPAAWSSAGVILHSSSIEPVTGLETVTMRSETPLGAAGIAGEFLRLAVKH